MQSIRRPNLAGVIAAAVVQRAQTLAVWDTAPELRSPFTPGVIEQNIAFNREEDAIRIDLWRDWKRMLAGIVAFGPVMTVTHNGCAALAQWRTYPELQWAEGGTDAIDASDEFDINASAWHSAYAKHERTPTGYRYSVEFLDLQNIVFTVSALATNPPLMHLPSGFEYIRPLIIPMVGLSLSANAKPESANDCRKCCG